MPSLPPPPPPVEPPKEELSDEEKEKIKRSKMILKEEGEVKVNNTYWTTWYSKSEETKLKLY